MSLRDWLARRRERKERERQARLSRQHFDLDRHRSSLERLGTASAPPKDTGLDVTDLILLDALMRPVVTDAPAQLTDASCDSSPNDSGDSSPCDSGFDSGESGGGGASGDW